MPSISQMSHFIMISDTNHQRNSETIKEFCQRYYDRLEEHPNNLTANLMKTREIVRKLERRDLQIY